MRKSNRERGNSLIEFTLVGIPLIFILISIFEMSRGMWMYETLAYAVREGTRYAIVHGQSCAETPNNCRVTVDQIARHIGNAGVGLLPDQLNITIQSANRTVTCSPLNTCFDNAACFPTDAACGSTIDVGAMAGMPITVTASYPFRSAIAMFWPGSAPIVFGEHTLRASSREMVQF